MRVLALTLQHDISEMNQIEFR